MYSISKNVKEMERKREGIASLEETYSTLNVSNAIFAYQNIKA